MASDANVLLLLKYLAELASQARVCQQNVILFAESDERL